MRPERQSAKKKSPLRPMRSRKRSDHWTNGWTKKATTARQKSASTTSIRDTSRLLLTSSRNCRDASLEVEQGGRKSGDHRNAARTWHIFRRTRQGCQSARCRSLRPAVPCGIQCATAHTSRKGGESAEEQEGLFRSVRTRSPRCS